MHPCGKFQLIWRISAPELSFTHFGEYSILVLNVSKKHFREEH